MGGSKATAMLGDEPLIAYPLAAARAAGLEAAVVAKPDTVLPELGVPVWIEPPEPVHPLCGVVAALARGPAIVVACDQPWVTAGVLKALATHDGPVLAVADEPFPGRYEPAQLPVLRDALAREASLRTTLARLSPPALGFDPALVRSVNTPQDLTL
jgi:molybdopterin-guanine dinucleotide biosynthesis protein A